MEQQDKRQEFWYISKKAEKLMTAVYILTDLLSDSEPIKRHLREASLVILKDIHLLWNQTLSKRKELARRIADSVEGVLSFMEIASATGLISRMNADILKSELEALEGTLQAQIFSANLSAKEDVLFSQEFFALPEANSNNKESNYKGHEVSDTADLATFTEKKRKEISTRREQIVIAVKENPNSTIKDIEKHFPDLGEKTLQRELVTLIALGLIKKKGERRWSRYSA